MFMVKILEVEMKDALILKARLTQQLQNMMTGMGPDPTNMDMGETVKEED